MKKYVSSYALCFFCISLLLLVPYQAKAQLGGLLFDDAIVYGSKLWDDADKTSILEEVGGSGASKSGDKAALDVGLSSNESAEKKESSHSTLLGGDYSTMRSSASYDPTFILQRARSFYTSPAAVWESSVALTGGVIHAGLASAEQASRDEAAGAFAQEQAYIMGLSASPNAAKLLERYRNCKQRILEADQLAAIASATTFQAIKHCTGSFQVGPAIPDPISDSSLSNASPRTATSPDDEDNRPEPIYVEQALRDDNGNPTQAGINRGQCQLPTTTFDSIPECFQRTLWDYVYHFVSGDPDPSDPLDSLERNSRKWTSSDEKSLYFGNIIYTEFKNSQQDLWAASGVNSSPQLANAIERREQELPPSTRWVNFWGPNGENAPTTFPLGDYSDGHWTPLKGVELLRAIFLQDYYGALYTLSFKMCEHQNSEIELLRRNDITAFNPKCPLWEAPIDAEWGIGSVSVPGLGVGPMDGCEVNGGGAILPIVGGLAGVGGGGTDYQYLWPSKELNRPPVNLSGHLDWQPRRFYENQENRDSDKLPSLEELRGHLQLNKLEALMLRDILLEEIPQDTASGQYQCNRLFNLISLGEIMDFSDGIDMPDPITTPWALLLGSDYREPKSKEWPLLSSVNDIPITERKKLFYEYAQTLAKSKAIQVVMKHYASLHAQPDAAREWPEKFAAAEKLVRAQLSGGGSVAGANTQISLLRLELIALKEKFRDLHEELQSSSARFSDKAGRRKQVGAGAAGSN